LLHLHLLHGDLRRGRALQLDAQLADFFNEGVWALLGCGDGGQRGKNNESFHGWSTPGKCDDTFRVFVDWLIHTYFPGKRVKPLALRYGSGSADVYHVINMFLPRA
jgi:hypothetical protein